MGNEGKGEERTPGSGILPPDANETAPLRTGGTIPGNSPGTNLGEAGTSPSADAGGADPRPESLGHEGHASTIKTNTTEHGKRQDRD